MLAVFAECAEANALGPYIAAVGGLRGELEIERGRAGEALGALEESLSRLRAARYELLTTPFSLALARGLMLDGRLHEARDLLEATIRRCDANGERLLIPELLRCQGGDCEDAFREWRSRGNSPASDRTDAGAGCSRVGASLFDCAGCRDVLSWRRRFSAR